MAGDIEMLVSIASGLTTCDRLSLIKIANVWLCRRQADGVRRDQIAFLSDDSKSDKAYAASNILRFPVSSARRK